MEPPVEAQLLQACAAPYLSPSVRKLSTENKNVSFHKENDWTI